MKNKFSIVDVFSILSSLATAGTLMYLMLEDYFKRPVLTLTFDPARDITDQQKTPTPDGDGFWPLSRWVRVRVVNTGRKSGKNARANIGGVQRVLPDGSVEQVMPSGKRPIAWQNDYHKLLPRDLHPESENWVDVAFTIAEGTAVFTNARPEFSFNQAGRYRIAVQVEADDAKVESIYLCLDWDGKNWQSLTACQSTAGRWRD